MSDELTNGFLRLEMMIGNLTRESERRFIGLESGVRSVADKVLLLEQEAASVRLTATNANDQALKAMRKASDSFHELESVSQGLMAHLGNIESSIAKDAKSAEETRKKIAAENERMFNAHGAAIAALIDENRKINKAASSRGQVNTALVVIAMVLIPALTASALEIIRGMNEAGIVGHGSAQVSK